MSDRFKTWLSGLSIEERIAEAENKIEVALDNTLAVIQVSAANKIINYSNVLSNQVPLSYAGVAYRVFAREMVRSEIIRLCTLWDRPGKDRNSLPTIAKLVDDDGVQQKLRLKAYNSRVGLSSNIDDDELKEWMRHLSRQDAERDGEQVALALDRGLHFVSETVNSDLLLAMIQFRDVHLAHSLAPRAKKDPSLKAKPGDQAKLLQITRDTLDEFNLGVRGSSFMWDDSLEIEERNAKALWHGVTIKVKE